MSCRHLYPFVLIVLLSSNLTAAGQSAGSNQTRPRAAQDPCSVEITTPADKSKSEPGSARVSVGGTTTAAGVAQVWVVVYPVIKDEAKDIYWVQMPAVIRPDGSWNTSNTTVIGKKVVLPNQNFQVKAFLNPTPSLIDVQKTKISAGVNFKAWPQGRCESNMITIIRER